MPAITIIVPVYNAEKYILQCLESIQRQTFKDFEVIIVDDGSTDSSGTLIKNNIQSDGRFHYYKIDNNGVSHARNVGLMYAAGEWVSFVDADDIVTSDYLESLYRLTSDSVDVVMGNFYFDYEDGGVSQGQCNRKYIHKNDFPSFPPALMVEDYASVDGIRISVEILCAACNKLTRKSLIDTFHIRFAEDLRLNEDGLFHLTCYVHANDIIITDKPLYHYYIRGASSNNRYRPDVHQQMVVWNQHFTKISFQLNDVYQNVFLSLSAYRRYLNLVNLFIIHSQNKQSFINRRHLLSDALNTGIYDVQLIPSNVKWFKKTELFALKHQLCSFLLVIAYLRKWLK